MQRTLLFIPHEILGLPVFGFGWLLILVVAAFVLRGFVSRRGDMALTQYLGGEGMMWVLMGILISTVLPVVELRNVDGEPVGLAIRGYGVMLLIGVLSAVSLAMLRAKNRGVEPDEILKIAPWAFIGGIVGARLFYIIQYFDRFDQGSLFETIRSMLTFTEGGLVVYGSFIGGFIAVVFYIWRNHLPLLKLGDAIVPCMFLGLFFGRIGCVMNGCCYGGGCEDYWAALHFPPRSPVYVDQMASGSLLGMEIDQSTGKIEQIQPESLAQKEGLKVGQTVERLVIDNSYAAKMPRSLPREDAPLGIAMIVDGKHLRFGPDQLPPTANPVQPAQFISSLSALTLCLLLCTASYFFRREGTIMLLGFASYAVLRFVLELIRVDEKGQFGTQLSISQWVSVLVLLCSIAGIAWLWTRGPSPQEKPMSSSEA